MRRDRLNISAAALRYRQVTLFFIIAIALAGINSYFNLGQREDPDFTFRAMIIRTLWPGATAEQVDQQITDRIAKKLQEVPHYKWTNAYSKPGESMITLELLDTAKPRDVPQIWYQVRKKIEDIRYSLPPETLGPFFNDEMGDVFGSIYAFTAEGFSHSELRTYVERARQEVLRLPDVAKAELVGVQDDRVYIEISNKRLAALGIDPQAIAAALAQQNALLDQGSLQIRENSLGVRVSGQFETVTAVRDLPLRANGQTIRLGDIGTVTRSYVDPPATPVRFGGKQSIALAISMVPNGDVLRLGENLKKTMAKLRQDLPLGIAFEQVSDQPAVVKLAVREFMTSLLEAVAIVLAVSFLSLGWRAGLVVGLTIPLVLCATFFAMEQMGVHLHRISTGALIIALGLLVDDAMIAVEMMARKLEEGKDKIVAATYAYATTAFPMLSGTLITVAGFLPIATAKSAAGEYTFTIFSVTAVALAISWFAAITATPLLGAYLLKQKAAGAPGGGHHEVFDTPFYARLRAAVEWCMEWRKSVIAATLAVFFLGVYGMGLAEKQFFPSSNRTEVMIEMWLPEGASIRASEEQARRLEGLLAGDKDVLSYVTFVGASPPRFFLSLDQNFYRDNLTQALVLTQDVPARERVIERLRKALDEQFAGLRTRVRRIPLGPPVDYPVQFRVIGESSRVIKGIAEEVAAKMRENPNTKDVNPEWGDQVLSLRVEVDQEKARALGVSSASISRAVAATVSGLPIAQYRERDRLISVVLRAPPDERGTLRALQEIGVPGANGMTVPLVSVANVSLAMEEPLIRRRSRELTMNVRAEVVEGVQAPDVTKAIIPTLKDIEARLPVGYRIEAAGTYAENIKAEAAVAAGFPMALGVVLALLMIQLRSFSVSAMVLLTAPLGVVGVAAALLVFNKPFGFVAMLGTIALAGMIMRNTVILADQIDQDIAIGHHPWIAVREATVRRFRPIALTAAAAVLAMIPLTRSVLWGPMAYAIMGGLTLATVLTLVFHPALYTAWFRIKRPGEEESAELQRPDEAELAPAE